MLLQVWDREGETVQFSLKQTRASQSVSVRRSRSRSVCRIKAVGSPPVKFAYWVVRSSDIHNGTLRAPRSSRRNVGLAEQHEVSRIFGDMAGVWSHWREGKRLSCRNL